MVCLGAGRSAPGNPKSRREARQKVSSRGLAGRSERGRQPMATIITSECINCGACEPECPNTAIYGGGVAWDLNGDTHPAISNDIYYIVPQKCTECVGFYDHEACAAVCPVDCCIPDPNNLETESDLLARAQKLHPEKVFPSLAQLPAHLSRFRRPAA